MKFKIKLYKIGEGYKIRELFNNKGEAIYQAGVEEGRQEYKELFLKLLDQPYSSNPSMLTEEGLKILLRQEIKKL